MSTRPNNPDAPGFPDPKDVGVAEAYLRMENFYAQGERSLDGLIERLGGLRIKGAVAAAVLAGIALAISRNPLAALLCGVVVIAFVWLTTRRIIASTQRSRAAIIADLNRMRSGEANPLAAYRRLWEDYRRRGLVGEALALPVDRDSLDPAIARMLEKYGPGAAPDARAHDKREEAADI